MTATSHESLTNDLKNINEALPPLVALKADYEAKGAPEHLTEQLTAAIRLLRNERQDVLEALADF